MTAPWREQVLAQLRPTAEEDAAVRRKAEALRERVQSVVDERGWRATPRVEGSVAKGTYLHEQGDADVFVAFDPSVPRGELDEHVHAFKELLDDAVVAYAEHPYVQGTFQGAPAEIVPCYALEDASELRSAVDRTPFHTEYVRTHLDDDRRDDVRLLKAFLYGAEAYGAEESVLGVSGYLAELLVLRFGSFEDVLAWAAAGFDHPVELDGPGERPFEEDAVVVVDPIDPERNVASAVAERTLERIREAAAAFRRDPSPRFFGPPAEPRLDGAASDRCAARGSRVVLAAAPTPEAELVDPVFAQMRRAVTLAAQALENEQIPVRATAVHVQATGDVPERAFALVEADIRALDRPYLHAGPPTDLAEHADRFREAWEENPEAVGDLFAREDRLHVYKRRDHDDLLDIVEPALREAKAGKVLDRALETDTATLAEGPEALEAAPGEALGRLLDRRPPWER